MVFHVVAVGRMKHAGLRSACDEYASRIARYVHFTVHEVSDQSRHPDGRRREAHDILRAVPGADLVAVTRTGRAYSSRAFADRVRRWQEHARDVAFAIGGSEGLDPALLDAASDALSLSSMTWPHDLARLMLFEQFYRANTIRRGEPYHKGA